jgi:hypothetical protein
MEFSPITKRLAAHTVASENVAAAQSAVKRLEADLETRQASWAGAQQALDGAKQASEEARRVVEAAHLTLEHEFTTAATALSQLHAATDTLAAAQATLDASSAGFSECAGEINESIAAAQAQLVLLQAMAAQVGNAAAAAITPAPAPEPVSVAIVPAPAVTTVDAPEPVPAPAPAAVPAPVSAVVAAWRAPLPTEVKVLSKSPNSFGQSWYDELTSKVVVHPTPSPTPSRSPSRDASPAADSWHECTTCTFFGGDRVECEACLDNRAKTTECYLKGIEAMFLDRASDAGDYDYDPDDLREEAERHVNWWITSFRGQNKNATDFALAMIEQFDHYGMPYPQHWYFLELWQKQLLQVPEENFRVQANMTGADGADFPHMATPGDVGTKCTWMRHTLPLPGTVRYVGPRHCGKRTVIGIELENVAPVSTGVTGTGLIDGLNQYYLSSDADCNYYENGLPPGRYAVVPSNKVQFFAAGDVQPMDKCMVGLCDQVATEHSYCPKHVHYHDNMEASKARAKADQKRKAEAPADNGGPASPIKKSKTRQPAPGPCRDCKAAGHASKKNKHCDFYVRRRQPATGW